MTIAALYRRALALLGDERGLAVFDLLHTGPRQSG